jgi:hypothetical protein
MKQDTIDRYEAIRLVLLAFLVGALAKTLHDIAHEPQWPYDPPRQR